MKANRTLCFSIGAALVLTACAGKVKEPDSYEKWTASQQSNLPFSDSEIAKRSRELFAQSQRMREMLEKKNPQPERIAPIRPTPGPMDNTLISLDVTNGELQHVIKALAMQAGLDLVIHPSVAEVSNRVSIHFTDAPASMVLDNLLRSADLFGKIDGNLLIIMPLEERIFKLDFMETSFTTDISAGGDILGNSNVSGGSSGGVSGKFEIKSEQGAEKANNPYEQLEKMLQTMVGSVKDPNSQGKDLDSATTISDAGAMARFNNAIQQDTPTYHLNRLTGTLFVRAKKSVMDNVEKLIIDFKSMLNRQIVIEAQIIDLILDEGHQEGVDWAVLNKKLAAGVAANGLTIGGITSTIAGGVIAPRSVTAPSISSAVGKNMLTVGYGNGTVNAVLNLLQAYGETRILSNPFLRTQHGRPALISVGTTTSYISATKPRETDDNGNIIQDPPDTSTVFDGLLVGIIPFIDEDRIISLTVNPIQSTVDTDSLALVDAGNGNFLTLPKVDLKELLTTLKIKDGDTVMLGGLIHRTRTNSSQRVPVLGSLPLFGKIFKKDATNETARELIIVLRVNVI
ncbi:MAG: hypothetical protein HQL72_11860 [Magnetococcales bacterium]|nr:hypothetical protein [Magnetococcales bacterium]